MIIISSVLIIDNGCSKELYSCNIDYDVQKTCSVSGEKGTDESSNNTTDNILTAQVLYSFPVFNNKRFCSFLTF